MREIKYRAWYKLMNRMIFLDEVDMEKYHQFFRSIDLKRMQYTGLCDKKGKEVYEGDIVSDKQHTLGIVKYHDGSYIVTTNYQGSDIFSIENHDVLNGDLIACNDLEVIGNVFEHSHLLEGEVLNESWT